MNVYEEKKNKHPWSSLLLHNCTQVALQQLSITLKILLIKNFNYAIEDKVTPVSSTALTVIFLQNSGTFAACAFQNPTCLSTIQIIYINIINESFQTLFCHINKRTHQYRQQGVSPPISATGRQPTNTSNKASALQYYLASHG